MSESESGIYVKKIILEIVDRIGSQSCRIKRKQKFIITRFNVREAAYAFLRQYQGDNLIKTQKINIWYNHKELHLRVHDLIYEKINRTCNTTVQFIHRKMLFSEIKWPSITVYRINRVRWASDHSEILPLKTIQPQQDQVVTSNTTDGNYSSIDVDEYATIEPRVPLTSCNHVDDDQLLTANSDSEKLINKEKHFLTSIYIHVNRNKQE